MNDATKKQLYDGLMVIVKEGCLPGSLMLRRALKDARLIGRRGDGIHTEWSITKPGYDLMREMSHGYAVTELTLAAAGMDLDSHVDTLKGTEASRINNAGISAQVEYMVKAGGADWAKSVILNDEDGS